MKVKCIIPQEDIDRYYLSWTHGDEYITRECPDTGTWITDNANSDHPYNPENFEEVKEDITDTITGDDVQLVRLARSLIDWDRIIEVRHKEIGDLIDKLERMSKTKS